MINLFAQYTDYLLQVDESNFSQLIDSLNYLHSAVTNRYPLDGPRFLPPELTKEQNIALSCIPAKGRNPKEVLNEAVAAFDGMIRWQHSAAVHNITPSPLLDAVAIRTLTSLYNPNCIWDFVSGNLFKYEKALIQQIAELFNWDKTTVDGLFSFGGKASLIYAVKMGINNCARNTVDNGLENEDIVILTSEASHYSLEYICILLGLGKKKCIRIPNDQTGAMDMNAFEKITTQLLTENKKIACVVLVGGNSLDNAIDPIEKAYQLIHTQVKKFSLSYIPHLHLDAVIGWAWMFFKNYQFRENPLDLPSTVKEKIELAYNKIAEIKYADSVGIDFHKNGFCPYITSLFLVADKRKLHSLNSTIEVLKEYGDYGQNFVQHYSIEHSRSGEGILSAWVVLQELGFDGFQRYIGQMITINQCFSDHIDESIFEVLNPNGLGFALVFFPNFLAGKYTDLYAADKEKVKHVSNYCKQFFNYVVLNLQNNTNPIIGYISNYRKNKDGINLPALKIYPMALATEEKDITDILSKLSSLKQAFDGQLSISSQATNDIANIVYPK